MKWLERIEAHVLEWFTSTEALRALTAELRDLAPILKIGGRTVVTRYDDVLEILDKDRHFSVVPVYAEKMAHTTGDFFLGMDDSPRYRREVDVARRAVRSDDMSRIAELATHTARELIAAARGRRGAFDGVNDFSRLIPLRLVADYFGIPGPDLETMKRWMRVVFWDIFLNPNNDASVSSRSRVASAELKRYLIDFIGARKVLLASGAPPPNDFLTRLLRQQSADPSIDDDLVRRNVGGIIVGAVDTQSKVIAQVIDQLLRRPDALESARRAARAGNDALLGAHVWEALRYNPLTPALFRVAAEDTVIGEGTERKTVIEKGSNVLAFTVSGMFDPIAFEDPDAFRTDRPFSKYLHFGHGVHTCFGERINAVVIPLAIKELLLVDGLRYDDAGSRKIEYEGPFPDRMSLRFDPSA
jgi:cytochrome P450